MKCPNCGTENTGNFCTKCGNTLNTQNTLSVSPTSAKKNFTPLIASLVFIVIVSICTLFLVNRLKKPDLPSMEYEGVTYTYGMKTDIKPHLTGGNYAFIGEDTGLYLDIDEKTGERIVVGFSIGESSTATIDGLSVGDSHIKVEKTYPGINTKVIDSVTEYTYSGYTSHDYNFGFYDSKYGGNQYSLYFYKREVCDIEEYCDLIPSDRSLFDQFLNTSQALVIVTSNDCISWISFHRPSDRSDFHHFLDEEHAYTTYEDD